MVTKREKSEEKDTAPGDGDAKVDNYPERPYLEAVTPEHRKALEEWGLLPKED
jgi:hypothetical protein